MDTRAAREVETAPDCVEIALEGEIDVENAYEVREKVARALTDGSPTRIEIDMQRVRFIDSVGVSALVAAFQLAAVQGARLVITRPSRVVHRQLWVTGLLGLFGSPGPEDAERQGATGSRRSETTG
ncbi:STAS domain-containing protein [Actinoplanes sp. CA-131856]